MMQRRNKPIATPRGKGYNESKFSRHEERPVVTRRKQYHETNEQRDLKTADKNLKNNFRSEEVFAGP